MTDTQVIIQLGDTRGGAEVTMIKERDRYAIDEVLLIHGTQPGQRVTMKQELRSQLNHGLAQRPDGIQHASANSARDPQSPSAVEPAVYRQTVPATTRPSPPRELEEPEDASPVELWDDLDAIQTEPGVE